MAMNLSYYVVQPLRFGANLGNRLRLRAIFDRTADIRKSDIVMVANIDGPTGLLAHFCAYHRDLGVNHFLFIQHEANDSVTNYVRNAGDISLWQVRSGLKTAHRKTFELKNVILQRYCNAHLCVLVDLGEYLVYPHMQSRSLRDLGEFMRNERRESVHGVALDAYGEQASQGLGDQTGNPFDICPFIDGDGYFETTFPDYRAIVHGGPILRSVHDRKVENATIISRVPIVWWRWSNFLFHNDYGMRPKKLMRVLDWNNPIFSAAVIRFPFLASAYGDDTRHRKAVRALYGADYERAIISQTALYQKGTSLRFENADQLIEAGIMSPGNWF